MFLLLTLASREIPEKWVTEMSNKKYAFVVDSVGKPLAPTPENNAWYLIRKGRATLLQKTPMLIKLTREIPVEDIDRSSYTIGIDDGSKHVGIAIVQVCSTKIKTVFKGTLELRNDVSKKMELRKGYRQYKRSHKRYRPIRFSNRASSRRKGRLAPTIKQKKDSILRVVKKLTSMLPSTLRVALEDVAIDIRALQEGNTLPKWKYQKSNRLDENVRKAVIIRDNNCCQNCGATNCRIEVHHIVPRRLKGNNTIDNLISLCEPCHEKVTGAELDFASQFQMLIKGKNIRFDFAQHVMQGKNYLRTKLSEFGEVTLTTGGDTANNRIDLGIEKTHANDAVVIAGGFDSSLYEYTIKPLRKKSKALGHILAGFKCRDVVKYVKRNGDCYLGYITSLDPKRKTCNITTFTGKELKRYSVSRLQFVFRPKCILWM